MRPASTLLLACLVASPTAAQVAASKLQVAPLQATAAPAQRAPGDAKLQAYLAPSLRAWVRAEARRIADAPDAVATRAAVRERLAGQAFTEQDIEALAFLVLKQAADDAQEDLRATMEEMKASSERKRAMREAAGAQRQAQAEQDAARRVEYAERAAATGEAKVQRKDEPDEETERQQARLQRYSDRRTKAMEAISTMMEKSSETQANITANLK